MTDLHEALATCVCWLHLAQIHREEGQFDEFWTFTSLWRFWDNMCIIILENNKILVLFMIQDLGGAGSTKRPTSCLLVLPVPPKGGVSEEESAKFKVSYEEVVKEVQVMSQAIYA